jgi:tetratricopeptide (TPR) repeat protein
MFNHSLDFPLLIQLGKACSQVKEFADAIRCYQQAITQQSHQPWLYALLGEALQNNQQPKAAIEAYNQAIKLGLDSPLDINQYWRFIHSNRSI